MRVGRISNKYGHFAWCIWLTVSWYGQMVSSSAIEWDVKIRLPTKKWRIDQKGSLTGLFLTPGNLTIQGPVKQPMFGWFPSRIYLIHQFIHETWGDFNCPAAGIGDDGTSASLGDGTIWDVHLDRWPVGPRIYRPFGTLQYQTWFAGKLPQFGEFSSKPPSMENREFSIASNCHVWLLEDNWVWWKKGWTWTIPNV